jgi:hypothetical protein
MNDRELDLLIQHVFGDAEGDEAAEAARVAARSPQEAALWTELKSDLRRLNEVPECQMSVERLQHAILNKTQKEAVKGWSLAKVFGGLTAVAAGAFAITMSMNLMKTAGPDQVIKPTSTEVVAMNEKSKGPDVRSALVNPSGTTPAPTTVTPKPDSNPRRTNQVIIDPPHRGHDAPNAFDSADFGSTLGTPAPEMNLTSAAPTTGNSGAYDANTAMKSGDDTNPEDSVVIVESSTNQDGTRQAKEVSRNDEDIVFGG